MDKVQINMNKPFVSNVLKILIVILLFVFIIDLRSANKDYWSGVYYPQGNLVGNAIYSPHFQNKEECIGWAINERGLRKEDKDVPLADLWECNKNCKLAPSYTTLLNATQNYKQELLDGNKGPLYFCDDGGFDGEDWLRGDF